jgi:protein-S-isoprenylcysteine O-methyltransferase Ste14
MRRTGAVLGGIKAGALVAVWFLLRWLATTDIGGVASAVLIVAPLVLVAPASLAGRKVLDRYPGRVLTVTAAVDLGLIVLFGVAVVEALRTASLHPGSGLAVPDGIGLALMWVIGPFLALTVVNLALRGLGAPFAAPISRRLATDWLYRYTRNPMVLALLLFFLAVGVWLRSAWFIAWVVAAAAPAWIFYLKIFEERELELRFGAPYLEYRARTSMLWPRAPRPPEVR